MIGIVLQALLPLDLQLHFSMTHVPQLLLDLLLDRNKPFPNRLAVRISDRGSNLGRGRYKHSTAVDVGHRAILNHRLQGQQIRLKWVQGVSTKLQMSQLTHHLGDGGSCTQLATSLDEALHEASSRSFWLEGLEKLRRGYSPGQHVLVFLRDRG